MTQHEDLVYLGHMLDMARDAIAMTSGKSIEEFKSDSTLEYAVAHVLSVIGEAARKVSSTTKSEMTSVPWNQIIGMRHRLVHDYFAVDLDRVWDTITNDILPLIEALERVVPSEPPS
jgi:uncharacterized protein with HEPN domain